MDHGCKSTLLNSTGNVELDRISDETRRKGDESMFDSAKVNFSVAADSKRIYDHMQDVNRKSRRRFKLEDHERLRKNEVARLNMIADWQQRTKANPLAVDQNLAEERRIAKMDRIKNKQAVYNSKITLIESMKGKPGWDICSKNVIRNLEDEEIQLALELRQHYRVQDRVAFETEVVKQMMRTELHETTKDFANLFAQSSARAKNEAKEERASVDDNRSVSSASQSTVNAHLYHQQHPRLASPNYGSEELAKSFDSSFPQF